jgi:hypothetical protein
LKAFFENTRMVKPPMKKLSMKLVSLFMVVQLMILTGWSTYAYFVGPDSDFKEESAVQQRISITMQEERPEDPIGPEEESPSPEGKIVAKEKEYIASPSVSPIIYEISLFRARMHHLTEEWHNSHIPPVQSPPPEA